MEEILIKNRSIGQRLERCKSPTTALEILQEWLTDYNNEQHTITRKLREALNFGDTANAIQLITQLESTSKKRSEVLQSVIIRIGKFKEDKEK